tara:strand:+ start:1494 stop:3182 length:1689 start_codon:yes stop_codon:yes gene_type:complete
MEKNAILAAVLSLAVLLGWQYFFVPQEPPKKKDVSTKAPLQQKLSSRQKGSITDRAIRVSPKKSHAPKTENLNARKRSLPKNFKEILVKVDVGNAVYGLTNYGAGFVQMQLNDYKDEKGKFIDLAKGYYSDLKPLFFWGSGSGVLNRAFYKVYVNGQEVTESKTIKIGSKKGGQKVTFVLQGKAQEKVEKSLFFSAGSYRIPTTILIRNAKNLDALGVALGPSVGGSDGDTYGGVIEGPMSFVDKDIVYDNPESDNDQPKYDKNVKWTSLQSKYFITALVPRTGSGGAQINLLKANKDRANDYAAIVPLRSENSRVLATMDLYAGPKEVHRMSKLNVMLEESLDYGIFSFVASPLISILRICNAVTMNWGLAIILLTIIIKLIFYPLTHFSMKNMKGMQKLQPKMAQIREIYKDDKTKMNQQLMSLYKENKVNPMMGCLPMLIQMPIFFGLYEGLLVAIEIRNAPFFWWITDLSKQDPYHVYTVLMGISMFIQQKMTPTAGDPSQAKMMMFMPVIFCAMFIFYPVPSGLVIYWFVNNVLSIGQQFFVNRSVQTPKLAQEDES